MRRDPDEALQVLDGLAIGFRLSQLLDAFVISPDFLHRLIVADEIFPQCLVEKLVPQVRPMQPLKVLFRPVRAFAVEMPVARAEGDRLLLDTLELGFHILPHADVLFDRVVFLRWDIDGAVGVVCETPADAPGVHAVVLHMFPGRDGHGGRREDDALDAVIRELMVQGIAKAAGLIAAKEAAVPAMPGADAVEVFEDLPIVRLDLDLGENAVIFHGIAAKCVICGMDIHPDIEYT